MTSPFETDFDKVTTGKGKKSKPAPDYDTWLARGQKLADKHSGYQWKIGDWLVEGDEFFNAKNLIDIPRHMLIGRARIGADGETEHKALKVPNFWKDISDVIGLAVSTLKQYVQVARAYPKKRITGLGWSHHMFACSYDRRYEYLKACLDVPEGQRPHSVNWLCELIAREEGENASEGDINRTKNFVRIAISDEAYEKLKELAKYYGTDVAEIASVPFKAALEVFLEEQKKKVSLDLFGVYEAKGKRSGWPFDRLQTRRQKATFWEARHYKPRMMGDDLKQFSEAQSQRARDSWAKRRARRHNGLSVQITRLGRGGIVRAA
ncbi:MAG TPA: hypothetical protein VK805_15200 [Candidatus Baltobacteraceae bacterium]|nr:hypothetical protein [Candidatus Baltobacteraceae bacterium]